MVILGGEKGFNKSERTHKSWKRIKTNSFSSFNFSIDFSFLFEVDN